MFVIGVGEDDESHKQLFAIGIGGGNCIYQVSALHTPPTHYKCLHTILLLWSIKHRSWFLRFRGGIKVKTRFRVRVRVKTRVRVRVRIAPPPQKYIYI